jgi:hypothetical protein
MSSKLPIFLMKSQDDTGKTKPSGWNFTLKTYFDIFFAGKIPRGYFPFKKI